MPESPSQLYLVRLSGTISTKSSQTRKAFQRTLEDNIRDALEQSGDDFSVERRWNRIFVRTDSDEAVRQLTRVAGVQSIRPAVRREWDTLADIVEAGRKLFADRVEDRTFAVRARRVGHRDPFPFRSDDVKRELGRALVEAGGEVDLDAPEVEVRLELHIEEAFVYERDIPGPGGLPVGVEGRALAMISGGFDSAVAARQMLKRGVALDFVFFNLGGPPHERGVRQVAGEVAKRWAHGSEPQLHVVDFRPLLAELKTEVDGSYWQVVLKRLMFRAADRVADDEGHPALVSGEAIGQVSSQTLHNLAAIDDVADRLVLRPLCGYNKEEILEIARDAGLHDVTEHIPEFCALEGPRPVTRTNPDKLDRHESAIDVELVKPLVDDRDVLDLRSLEDEPPLPQVQTDRIPEDAAVVDLRREEAHDRWHYPDALHVPFDTALEQHALLPPDPTYVFYCDVGLKSALIAEKMRKSGFDAFSYEGTISELRELAGESDRERAN